jgi:hypothetical protein
MQHACAQSSPSLRGPRTSPPVDFTTCLFGLPTAGRRSSPSTWSSRPSVPAGVTPGNARWACRPPCSIQCRVFIDCVHPHLNPQCDNTSKASHFALLKNLLHAVIVPACPNIHRAKPRATANESTIWLSSYEELQFWNALRAYGVLGTVAALIIAPANMPVLNDVFGAWFIVPLIAV